MANYWHILSVKRSDGQIRYQLVREGEIYPFDYPAYEDAEYLMNQMNSFESLMSDLNDAFADYDALMAPYGF